MKVSTSMFSRHLLGQTLWLIGCVAFCGTTPSYAKIVINEVLAQNLKTTADPCEADWIELYNEGDTAVNVTGMYLTDDLANPRKWRIPAPDVRGTIIAAKGYLLIWADGTDKRPGLHANFGLSADGEDIGLFDADGATLVDSVTFGQQTADVSYGRFPDGAEQWRYMGMTTPGASNKRAYEGIVAEVEFSHTRGFYDNAFNLRLTTATPGATIYYTVDGSDPVAKNGVGLGAQYVSAIPITTTTCVRAAAVKVGWLGSVTVSASYLFLSDIIHQSSAPAGFPSSWGKTRVDYAMDSRVVDADPTIKDDLKTIPSVSIVMNKDDLFEKENGIYANLRDTSGVKWERASSIEWIDPTTGDNFQVNTGIRMHGSYYGRNPDVGKHAFRILFKGAYGPTELVYPLFKDGEVDHFDTLVLRSIWNYSWFGDSSGMGYRSADYLRDLFCRDTTRDMGELSPRGRPVHVYVDGLYWGLFILSERPDDGFLVNHLGGEKEDYDLIFGDSSVSAKKGDMSTWNAMMTLAAKDMSNSQNYLAMQQYVDMTNMIDYMLMIYQSGSRDAPTFLNNDGAPHNMFAARSKDPAGPFLFLPWDVEWVLEQPTVNRVTVVGGANGPHYLVSRLKANADFKMLMADRIYRFFFNDGALTPNGCINRYGALADEIDRAIIGESARWGDSTGTLYTRADWVNEVNRLKTSYFSVRTDTVVAQLKSAGLYPTVAPPDYSVSGQPLHGGHVAAGSQLSMQNPNTGTSAIWYTLDGTDPRARTTGGDAVLVTENAAKKVLVPTAAISDAWKGGATFDDSAWTPGVGGVGYENSTGYESYFSIDVKSQMYGKNATCYIRIPFTVAAADVGTFSSLVLSLRLDDGFIAYINGVEVARTNFTGTPAWNSKASGQNLDQDAIILTPWTLAAVGLNALHAGENILAIQALNESTTSSDFLLSAELKGTRSGGMPSATALKYTGPVALPNSVVAKARVLVSTSPTVSTWSALNEAVYAVGPVAQSLRISEVMYHPAEPNTEFIELVNTGAAAINLNLVQFTKGITFTFGNVELAPHAYTLVVQDLAAFQARYGASLPVAGQYQGSLSNGGERIQLRDAAGTVIEDFSYSDGWYDLTDGLGFSLTALTPAAADPNHFADKSLWRPSAHRGGSPGYDDSGVLPEPGAVVINELMANDKKGGPDWIELHNTTAQPINVGGWFLSDDANDLMKYQIAAGTTIDANGYIVFYENTQFGNAADPGCHVKFALSRSGEAVYLHAGAAGALAGYCTQEKFDAVETGVSLGRWAKSTGAYNFVELSTPTPGAANAAPKVGPIVISEIMYHPAENPDAEYVELLNIGKVALTLFDPDVNLPWRFTDDPQNPTIDLLLPGDVPVTLLPGGRLILTKNLEAFKAQFGAPAEVPVLAWGAGWLSDTGEKIQLSKPSDNGHWLRVDRVVYSDGSHPSFGQMLDPWPVEADGFGSSLTRIDPTAYGNDPANWKAAAPSPGVGNP